MVTIESVTDGGAASGENVAPAAPAGSVPAAAGDTARAVPAQRSAAVLAGVLGTVVTALLGGMFLFMISAIGDLRDDIGDLRAEMNARFAEVDRKFDQVNAVLLDHTDRLARIETVLGIDGRPVPASNGTNGADGTSNSP